MPPPQIPQRPAQSRPGRLSSKTSEPTTQPGKGISVPAFRKVAPPSVER
jgi:hypothetical protein